MATAPTPGVGKRLAAAAEPRPQVPVIRFDGTDVDIRDLPIGVITDLARKNNVTWAGVMNAPAATPELLLDVIGACAELVGQTAPPPPTTGRDALTAFDDYIFFVDDDLPAMPDADAGVGENPTDASEIAG